MRRRDSYCRYIHKLIYIYIRTIITTVYLFAAQTLHPLSLGVDRETRLIASSHKGTWHGACCDLLSLSSRSIDITPWSESFPEYLPILDELHYEDESHEDKVLFDPFRFERVKGAKLCSCVKIRSRVLLALGRSNTEEATYVKEVPDERITRKMLGLICEESSRTNLRAKGLSDPVPNAPLPRTYFDNNDKTVTLCNDSTLSVHRSTSTAFIHQNACTTFILECRAQH